MTDFPLFSILIANYNNGRFLEEAVRSVYNQTYPNWEIIIVDDCSTDGSQDVYTTLKDDLRIKIFYNSENRGCGYTKHRCIEEARGEICGFLDPDDALTKDALEIMVVTHNENPDKGLIYSECYCCDSELNIINSIIDKHQQIKEKKYICENQYIVGAFAAFKKSVYEKTAKLNVSYKRAIDQDLYYLLNEVSDLLFVDKCLYFYRIHDKGISTMNNNYKAFAWHIAVIIDTCRRCNINFEEIVENKILHQLNIYAENKVYLNNLHIYSELNIIKKELELVYNSYSFRVGRFISKLLYPLRRILSRNR